jgi:aryl-alcohol dehydrogenase-like predicted oxidoreductase
MHYVQMGDTDFEVSDIVHGTYKAGAQDWGAVNDIDSVAAIQHCVDAGINLIDTATGYGMGRAERIIRYALDDEGGNRRGKTKIMTKWYLWQGPDEEMVRSVDPAIQEQFLAGCKTRLGVEKLDVVLLHRDDTVTPIETAIEALATHQSNGDIDYIGASNYSLEHLQRAQKVAPLQNYQPRFCLLDTSLRDDGRLDFCRENSISIGCFGVVGKGRLAPRLKDAGEYPSWDGRSERHAGPGWERWKKAHAKLQKVAEGHNLSVTQLAIAWVLSHPGITFAIVGASTPEQAEHNIAASGVRLEQDVLDECEAIVKEGKGK